MCPERTLHVSLAWLVAVHASYRVDKDSLWERYGEEWMAELRRIAARHSGFRITYEHVVATDSAVIALAQPSEPVNRIREAVRERLRLPAETRNEADLVHTTLFRYRGVLSDPAKFLATLGNTRRSHGRGRGVSSLEGAGVSVARSGNARTPPARCLVSALTPCAGASKDSIQPSAQKVDSRKLHPRVPLWENAP